MPDYAVGDRGEFADHPFKIPARGWRQVLSRVWNEVQQDRLSIICAGISYYCLLSFFPGIALLIMIYGMVGDPASVRDQMSVMSLIMPGDAYGILAGQLEKVTSAANDKLSVGVAISFAIAAWSSSRAINALMIALNMAYEETEKRNFFKKNLIALLMTIGGVAFFILSIVVIAAVPAAINILGLGNTFTAWLASLRWVVLGFAAIVALALVYRYAPSRNSARFRWLTPGAVVATGLWLLGSVLFSFYVTHFGSYNETFGSLAAVVVLLFWFYISAFVVCLGAELNAELEYQTYRDSTSGVVLPIGRRGAYVADHVAHSSE